VPLASSLLKMGAVRAQINDGPQAARDLDRARQIILRVLSARPKDKRALKLATDIDGAIVRQAWDLRDSRRARPFAEEAMRMAARLVALDPAGIESRDYLSQAQSTLGSAYRATGELELSAQSYREMVKLREQLVREQPGNTGYRRNLMVGYGHLSDALGPPRSNGLGDLDGAADALRKAADIARWLCRSDPADRKARFDLASAQSRLGVVLLAQSGRLGDALAALEESEKIFADVQKQDPANGRYRFAAIYAVRKTGEAMAAARRWGEATRRLMVSMTMAETFFGTRYEEEARNNNLAATVALARVKAETGDASAIAFADRAAGWLVTLKSRPDILWARAQMYAEVAGVYRRLGERTKTASCLEHSAQMWKDLKLPAALESQRQKELAAVNATLASLY
jgi:tetratricopeptide (TPR) repeat protein